MPQPTRPLDRRPETTQPRARWWLLPLIAVAALAACETSGVKAPDVKVTAAEKASSQRTEVELKKEKVLSASIHRLLDKRHLRKQKLDDSVSKKAFDEYLEFLDPTKTFLLDKHVKALNKNAATMDDQLDSGRLTLPEEAHAVQKERITVVKGMVETLLAKPFDYDKAETLQTDPEKRPWCTDDKALKDRWRKILKLQTMARIERLREVDEAKVKAQKEEAEGKDKEGEGEGQDAKANGGDAKPDEGDAKAEAKADTGDAKVDKDDAKADKGDDEPARVKSDDEYEREAREKLLKDYSSRFTRLLQQEHIDEIELFFNALASVYDPHTSYLPPARKENFDISMSGSLEGIGAVLQEHESYIKVVRIVPGSASWRQGELEAGDLILGVAQADQDAVDVVDMRLRDVVKMIRGKKGTVVNLTVKKPEGVVEAIAITRDIVNIEASYAKGAVLKHQDLKSKVGYIDLPSFYGNTRRNKGGTPDRRCSEDVKRLLVAFNKRGISNVILDLRRNGGGLLTDATRMSGLFIEDGPIVQTRTVQGELKVLEDPDDDIAYEGRLVVMVDSLSASASEILAGAMQDYDRAVIVGTDQTHGKGTVQQLLSLDRMVPRDLAGDDVRPLGVFKMTLSQFFRVNGASTQHRGVIPDIGLPDPLAHIDTGERHYDHSIPWSKVDPVKHEDWSKKDWDLDALRKSSKGRVADNDAFQRVISRTNTFKTRKDDTVEPLKRKTWLAKREKEEAEIKKLTLEDEDRPVRFEVDQLDYDGAVARRKAQIEEAKKDADRKTGQDEPQRWAETLGKDPWVEEVLFILKDMGAT